MPISQSQSVQAQKKRERDALWSAYDPYFPPRGSDRAGRSAEPPRAVVYDPYFPARAKV